jgi:DUF1009 family protein
MLLPPAKLAILAGGGELPKRLAASCVQQNRPLLVVALVGEVDGDGWYQALPHLEIRLGETGALLDQLAAAGVTAVVFAGRVKRPSLASLRPDWATAKLALRVGLNALGDDGLLRALAKLFEERGMAVVAAQDLLAELLVPAGQLGAIALPPDLQADVDKAIAVARALAPHDVGHAVVVQQGVVLTLEAAEGTDAMLIRAAALKTLGSPPVLVKLAKPMQDVRLDLPAIGPHTIATAAKSGIGAVVVSAGKTLMLDYADLIQAADQAGIALIGWPEEAAS